MKSGRLLSALLLLQSHGRLSTREIAERLEVSERTAHRDMEALSSSGIPLTAYRGAQGGWELARNWRTKVPGLDDLELQGLLMAQPSGLGDPRLSAAAQRAFDKLVASLPASLRTQAETMRTKLHIDSTGWRPGEDDLSMLPFVQEALSRDCKLTFLYASKGSEARMRTVDPLGLVCKQAAWYLIARTAEGMRTYKVSRMQEVTVLAMTFKRPAKFDLARYWVRSTAALREQRQRITVTLALSPEGVQTLLPWCILKPPSRNTDELGLPEGWEVYEVEFEHFAQARFVALGLGSKAIPLTPAEFCNEVAREVRSMATVISAEKS